MDSKAECDQLNLAHVARKYAKKEKKIKPIKPVILDFVTHSLNCVAERRKPYERLYADTTQYNYNVLMPSLQLQIIPTVYNRVTDGD